MDSLDDLRSFFGLPDKAAEAPAKLAQPPPSSSGSSSPFSFSAPKLPEMPKMDAPKMPDGSALDVPSAPSGGGPFGFSLPSAPKLPELGLPSSPAPDAGGLSLPKLPEFGLPSLSLPSVTSTAEPVSGALSAADVPWGLFLVAFTVFPAIVILGSKAMEMMQGSSRD